jgi:hypothetical protein
LLSNISERFNDFVDAFQSEAGPAVYVGGGFMLLSSAAWVVMFYQMISAEPFPSDLGQEKISSHLKYDGLICK